MKIVVDNQAFDYPDLVAHVGRLTAHAAQIDGSEESRQALNHRLLKCRHSLKAAEAMLAAKAASAVPSPYLPTASGPSTPASPDLSARRLSPKATRRRSSEEAEERMVANMRKLVGSDRVGGEEAAERRRHNGSRGAQNGTLIARLREMCGQNATARNGQGSR